MDIEKGDVIYEYNLAGMMVGIHYVYLINFHHNTFTIGRGGDVRLRLIPGKDGKLTQANRARGKKKGTYYIECNKTKRDKVMMALRAKLIDYIERSQDIKELQKLYATAKSIVPKVKAGNSEEIVEDEPEGSGALPADDSNNENKK